MGDQREVFLGVDLAADGSATLISFDGKTFRYLGQMTSDGLSFDPPEPAGRFYTNAAGQRVEIPELPPLSMSLENRSVTLTSNCRKCGSRLAACEGCGFSAVCGDVWCVDCQPD
jgi:hypothetical protein